MNKFFCIIAVSVVCLCGSSYAATEAWHVSLNANGQFYPSGPDPCQIVPDGSGGVACSYWCREGATNVIQWVNAQGHQIYSFAMDGGYGKFFTIIGLDKSHLVYSIGNKDLTTNGCVVVVVDKLGRETRVANGQVTLPNYNGNQLPQLLQNDKNGFFIIRYTGDGADGELVRFLYK